MLNEASVRRLAHEYRSRSLYRVCGGALIAAGLLFALSLLAGGGSFPQDLPELRSAAAPGRVALLWLAVAAPALVAGALLAIARQYRGTSNEAWVLLALAMNLIGGSLLTLAFALGAVGAPAALAATRALDPGAASALALTPVALVATSASAVGGMLSWLSLLPLSVALTRDRLWPRAAAWGAGIVAIAEVVAAPALRGHGAAEPLLRLAGYGYLVLLGLSCLRLVGTLRSAAIQAERASEEG